MLKTPAPFPQAGCFALAVDSTLPMSEQRAELVRVLRHDGGDELRSVIAFPLRTGASGTRSIPRSELIDPTPLTKVEERELADLQFKMRGRSKVKPADTRRSHALRNRLLFSEILSIEMKKLDALTRKARRREGASAGSFFGRNVA